MRTPAYQFNRSIAFVPQATIEDALGVEINGDGIAVPARAKVLFGTGAERREAGQAGSQQSATFRVRSTAALRGVDARWEIDFQGARWGIASVVPIDRDGIEIEFTATRKGA